jgi:hypothetical protein
VSLLGRPAEKRTNHDFFDLINSEEKAYWLGFLYADGNLAKSRWYTSLMLSKKDEAHLEKFALIFAAEVKDLVVRSGFKPNSQASYVRINSTLIWDSLYQKGLVPKKSCEDISSVFKNIPPDLMNHFIRGIFDGDGCASLQKGKRFKIHQPILRFTGNRPTLEKILEILSAELGLSKNKKFPLANKKSQTVSLSWGGKNIVSKIFRWMYADALTFLERKRLILEGAI